MSVGRARDLSLDGRPGVMFWVGSGGKRFNIEILEEHTPKTFRQVPFKQAPREPLQEEERGE